MENNYLNAIANHGASLITHIGLVDETGTEISGGDPAYARQSVTWDDTDGLIRPSTDRVFDIPENTTVGGWKGYSASTGGTEYGGGDLTNVEFSIQGTYTLQASGTGINHQVAP